jgi:hypothetical protein
MVAIDCRSIFILGPAGSMFLALCLQGASLKSSAKYLVAGLMLRCPSIDVVLLCELIFLTFDARRPFQMGCGVEKTACCTADVVQAMQASLFAKCIWDTGPKHIANQWSRNVPTIQLSA